MKQPIKYFLTLLAAALVPLAAHAQGTAFTYQGRLNASGAAANGSYDLRFALFDALTVGNQAGAPLTNAPVSVSNGLFTVVLDFGANFPGADRWLEIGVRTNGGGAFATLNPRQPITATPYAIRAASAASATAAAVVTGNVPASQITGTLVDARLSANVALRGGGNAFTGNQTITGGNVGIGTATPSATLDVAGTIRAGYLAVEPTDGATEGGELLLRGAAAFPDWAMDVLGSSLRFHTGGLTKLQVDPAAGMTVLGNVGIGTAANPSATLDVAGSIRAGYLHLNPVDGGTEGGEILLRGAAAFPDWIMDVSSSSLRFHTLGGVKLQIDPTTLNVYGNVTLNGTLGTMGNQPLEFYANGQRGLRLQPTAPYYDSVNVIGGSARNFVSAGAVGATIGGGGAGVISQPGNGTAHPNRVEADFGTVSGGVDNTIQSLASYATIGGGDANTIQTGAFDATIGGGVANTIQPYAYCATIPGGRLNSAASYAFAAGRRAKANHAGAFVWADSTDADFASTANNQFLIRASGGVGIGTGNPQGTLHVASPSGYTSPQLVIAQQNTGDHARLQIGVDTFPQWTLAVSPSATPVLNFWNGSANAAWLNYNGALFAQSFNPTSDRHAKENFKSISPREVLEKVAALPISEWNFKTAPGEPHIGPMAQDFHAAFGTGTDDKHIATVDADGVALAAIQGLNQKVEESRAENAELKRELSEIKQLLLKLADKKD